jgi:hypothetical protein
MKSLGGCTRPLLCRRRDLCGKGRDDDVLISQGYEEIYCRYRASRGVLGRHERNSLTGLYEHIISFNHMHSKGWGTDFFEQSRVSALTSPATAGIIPPAFAWTNVGSKQMMIVR